MPDPSFHESAALRSQKKRSRKEEPDDSNIVPPELQELFYAAVKEAAGKPLSMAPGSPLGRVIGAFVEHCLAEEMEAHLGYAAHERQKVPGTPVESRRKNTRNGSSTKRLKTSMGTTKIAVPRDRADEFAPQIVPKYATMTAEIEQRVIAMYAHGMTTRDIAEHVRELYHFEASENFVSRLTERIDPELAAWRSRPLESIYAILYVDAVHLKVRHANGVASTAVYIVSGYAESGCHEILGIWIAPSDHSSGHGESASFWQTVLIELEKRGCHRVLMVCSDGLTGLSEALASVYSAAHHIPCIVHQMRASLRTVPYQYRKEVARHLKPIYQAPSYQAAETALVAFTATYGITYPTIVRQWETLLPRLANLWRYSQPLRRMVYTTNPQENINRQIRKVTKSRGAMPSIDSALRLLTLVVRKIDQRGTVHHPPRPDWSRIVDELHITFADALPTDWGRRS